MKKIYLIVVGLLFCFSLTAQTADTIIIKTHEDVEIKTDPSVGYTRYPVWAEFPSSDIEYYKVIACLQFECASKLRCGEWDYLNYIHIGKTGGVEGDSLGWEIGRFITPYGNSWHSNNNWKFGWYFDMSDFGALLHDSVQIVYTHTGYEANHDRGWKINLTFYLIPGTPPLSVRHITPLWTGSFRYGDENNPIEDHLTAQTVTLNENTETLLLKIIQTGHGMDSPDNCSEFCMKQRTVKIDEQVIDERYIWRECGFIALYPQAGTWLYDRANWCPGENVPYHDIYLQGFTGSSEHSFDLIMEPYIATENIGNWVISSYLFEYGKPNYQIDASIEEIIAPSTEYAHQRFNPICGNPIIVIKNNGEETLYSMTIKYGPKGGTFLEYDWSGSLHFTEIDTIHLPGVPEWHTGDESNLFEVQLLNPNGKSDQFPQSDIAFSTFEPVAKYPEDIIVFFDSNKAPSENYYYLIDLHTNDTILNRNNFAPLERYKDTVQLQVGNCYSIEFYDDGPPPEEYPLNKDGLIWWANNYDGRGYFYIHQGEKMIKLFDFDFGTKILHQFTAIENVSIEEIEESPLKLEVFPNPSTGFVEIKYRFYDFSAHDRYILIKDIFGKNLKEIRLTYTSGIEQLDLSDLPKGIYIVVLTDNNTVKKSGKLILQ
ncbi:MAG: T9SS type A sorting domain-containing protein [Bacteroidales bacterium]|jgi:hypothetical protein|nr:T9SS type A sorting domain-containing protein [Bacteroidales bacterium]